jgi:hypothetical protein
MWVFTQDGFISVVDNKHVPGKLTARARDRQSLALLADIAGSEIVQTAKTDYPYRTYVTREQYIEFLTANVDSLDYGNFKDRVWTTRGDRWHDACARVWGAMIDVSDKEAVGTGLYS